MATTQNRRAGEIDIGGGGWGDIGWYVHSVDKRGAQAILVSGLETEAQAAGVAGLLNAYLTVWLLLDNGHLSEPEAIRLSAASERLARQCVELTGQKVGHLLDPYDYIHPAGAG